MKKFGVVISLFIFVMLGNLFAQESNISSENQGKAWKVYVTYNIYYSYYENKDQTGLVAEGVYVTCQVLTFDEYAETKDEAESMAKDECATVCTRSWGKYVGTRTYKGKSYHAFEYRKVESARAE